MPPDPKFGPKNLVTLPYGSAAILHTLEHMNQPSVIDPPASITTDSSATWSSTAWQTFDQVLEVLARFELYLDESIEQAPGPEMDPWLDEGGTGTRQRCG